MNSRLLCKTRVPPTRRDMPSVLASHPTGNANVRNALRSLQEGQLLACFHTTLAVFDSAWTGKLAACSGLAELRRRRYEESLREWTATHPWREAIRLLSLRLGWSNLVGTEAAYASVYSVGRGLDREVASFLQLNRADAVYCYEDTALETFREAKRQETACIYDLPIGYWRAARGILTEEAERRPEWLPTMGGLKDTAEKLARKDEELRLADRILVASSFTKKTLKDCPFPIAPISVIPYGADDALLAPDRIDRASSDAPLRVLFVGGLSQRKGIADLFEGVELIAPHVRLTVIGRKPAETCAALDSALRKHRWIESLPRQKILEEMRAHDVLVFPSLFEGFGLVVTEALSQGLPVITTPHTCGPDVLTEGKDGFIVPIRDPQAIAEKLELLHRDRDRLAAMREAALKKAKTLTWESYRQGVVAVVREVLAAQRA
jgi:starch synthase